MHEASGRRVKGHTAHVVHVGVGKENRRPKDRLAGTAANIKGQLPLWNLNAGLYPSDGDRVDQVPALSP